MTPKTHFRHPSGERTMSEKKSPFCATRKCLVLLFVCILAGMGIVVAVTLLAPAVRERIHSDMPWWKTSIIYQVYPRSFRASRGGKTGDIKGITSKLDHFVYLNVGVIWLNPVYKSPMKDLGYDISNHTRVDPLYGTTADLEHFIQKAHAKGIKVILDFVPNHTSYRHKWFQKSVNMDPKYKDYYIWRNGSIGAPNNWVSVFGGSAWTYDKTRRQYYYHTYLSAQPDLNHRNPAVVDDMNGVLRFWLDRGADGFRVDAASFLFEAEDVSQNEQPNPDFRCPLKTECEKLFGYWRHDHTMNLPDSKPVIDGWRAVLDEYQRKDGRTRFLLAEARVTSQTVRDWWLKTRFDMTFNFELARVISNKHCIKDAVEKEYKDLPKGAWPNFVLGSHDISRVASVRGSNYVNAFNMLLLTLWGTPTTYYGEEIGMVDIAPTYAQSVDPKGCYYGKDLYLKYTRDKSRSPLQWDDSNNAGFTAGSATWLPVSDTYRNINVQKQINSSDITPIKVYRSLAELRQEESFTYGNFTYAVVNDNIFSYVRSAKGFASYLVAINFGEVSSVDDYAREPVSSDFGTVVVNTARFNNATYAVNTAVSLKQIILEPGEGLVIKL